MFLKSVGFILILMLIAVLLFVKQESVGCCLEIFFTEYQLSKLKI